MFNPSSDRAEQSQSGERLVPAGSPKNQHASPRRSRSPKRSGSRSPKRSGSRSPKRSRSGSPRTRSRSPEHRDQPPPSKVLGVFGLSPQTRDTDLDDIFSKFGKIDKIDLIIDRQTQRSKCFAFIYFGSVDDARKAKENCNGMNLHGRNIRTDFSYTAKAHSPTPGKYMGRPSKGNRRNVDRYEPYEYRNRSRYDYRDRGYDDRYPRYERERGGGSDRDRYDRDRYDRYERDRARERYDRERYEPRSYDRDRYEARDSSATTTTDDRYDYRDRYYEERYDRHRR